MEISQPPPVTERGGRMGNPLFILNLSWPGCCWSFLRDIGINKFNVEEETVNEHRRPFFMCAKGGSRRRSGRKSEAIELISWN